MQASDVFSDLRGITSSIVQCNYNSGMVSSLPFTFPLFIYPHLLYKQQQVSESGSKNPRCLETFFCKWNLQALAWI